MWQFEETETDDADDEYLMEDESEFFEKGSEREVREEEENFSDQLSVEEKIFYLMRENEHTQFSIDLLYSEKILEILSKPEECNFSNWGMLICDSEYREFYKTNLTRIYDREGDFFTRGFDGTYLLPANYDNLYEYNNLKAAACTNFEIFQALARNPKGRETFFKLIESLQFYPILESNIVPLNRVLNDLPCEVEDRAYILAIICLNDQESGIISELNLDPLIINFVLHLLEDAKPHENDSEIVEQTHPCFDKLLTLKCVQRIFGKLVLILRNEVEFLQNFIDHLSCKEINWPIISYLLYSEMPKLNEIKFDTLIRNYLITLINLSAKQDNDKLSYIYFESIFEELLSSERFLKYGQRYPKGVEYARKAKEYLQEHLYGFKKRTINDSPEKEAPSSEDKEMAESNQFDLTCSSEQEEKGEESFVDAEDARMNEAGINDQESSNQQNVIALQSVKTYPNLFPTITITNSQADPKGVCNFTYPYLSNS